MTEKDLRQGPKGITYDGGCRTVTLSKKFFIKRTCKDRPRIYSRSLIGSQFTTFGVYTEEYFIGTKEDTPWVGTDTWETTGDSYLNRSSSVKFTSIPSLEEFLHLPHFLQ